MQAINDEKIYMGEGNLNDTFHVWEKVEIVLQAVNKYKNPYTDIDVWVDLEGPNFKKRVFGFWDGDDVFKIRILAVGPGEWRWKSGSNQNDTGLNGHKGIFTAVDWTEEEKISNNCRRGFIQPTSNGHGLQYADGTKVYLLGDTWWATPTSRYKWFEDENRRPLGPEMGFKDMVQIRKEQGYNCIAMLASFPAWSNDGFPSSFTMSDENRTCIRAAWREPGTHTAKDMSNEGGRPFLFPGKVPGYENVVPDFGRINPEYFKHMDKKIDYLNNNGFTAFIEAARRDVSQVWKNYYTWPDSYARYIQYIFSRYQANNCIFSPIHFDAYAQSIPAYEYNTPANLVIDRYGLPAFGTLVSANAALSTLLNFGGPDQARWLSLHQTGNFREHEFYWYLTEIYNSSPAKPALNGEPYYPYDINSDASASPEDQDLNFRSGLYGSLLSGGFAGYIYGAEGMWGGDNDPAARFRMWDALQFDSGKQVQYVTKFLSGLKYWELIPEPDLVIPNKSGAPMGYRGWAYCARSADKDLFLLYFEKGCPQVLIRGLLPEKSYNLRWFDPRNGFFRGDSRINKVVADKLGRFYLPPIISDNDWGMVLQLDETNK